MTETALDTPVATIGRVVIAKNLDPRTNNGSTEAPAILTRVWGRGHNSTTVNAKVLNDGQDNLWLTSRVLFDTQGDADAWLRLQRDAMRDETYAPPYLVWPDRA